MLNTVGVIGKRIAVLWLAIKGFIGLFVFMPIWIISDNKDQFI